MQPLPARNTLRHISSDLNPDSPSSPSSSSSSSASSSDLSSSDLSDSDVDFVNSTLRRRGNRGRGATNRLNPNTRAGEEETGEDENEDDDDEDEDEDEDEDDDEFAVTKLVLNGDATVVPISTRAFQRGSYSSSLGAAASDSNRDGIMWRGSGEPVFDDEKAGHIQEQLRIMNRHASHHHHTRRRHQRQRRREQKQKQQRPSQPRDTEDRKKHRKNKKKQQKRKKQKREKEKEKEKKEAQPQKSKGPSVRQRLKRVGQSLWGDMEEAIFTELNEAEDPKPWKMVRQAIKRERERSRERERICVCVRVCAYVCVHMRVCVCVCSGCCVTHTVGCLPLLLLALCVLWADQHTRVSCISGDSDLSQRHIATRPNH